MDQKTLDLVLKEIHAIKATLANLVTKDDAQNFATKDDLINLEKRFAKKFATKKDIKKLVTKVYFTRQLKKQLKEQNEDICQINTEIFNKIDEQKASQEDFDQQVLRIDRLEQKMIV